MSFGGHVRLSPLQLFLLVFFGARAALFRTILDRVSDGGHNFGEGRLHSGINTGLGEARASAEEIFGIAFAAALFVLNITRRFRALQLTFGTRARRRFSTRPRARRLFT